MKILIIVISIILAAIVGVVFLVISFFDNILVEEWTIFKLKYRKQYGSLYEETLRMQIYAQNRIVIARHNQRFLRGQESFEVEVNQFSDLQGEEFRRTMLGFRPIYNTSKGGYDKPAKWIPPQDSLQLPLNVDWRDRDAVTRVKNQGNCGSCWAFSATGALESQWFLQNNKLVELSEQNVIDCSGVIHACKGSTPYAAYEGIMEDEGINSERDYPYEAQQNDQCKFNPLAVAASVQGAKALPPDETVLMQAVASIGPISVVIRYKDSFQHYSSGVYYEAECSWGEPHADYHAVLVVGYGTTSNGVEYWLIKNSWGEYWGDSGYVKMARNRNNMCGIANMAIFPLVPVNGNITFPNKVTEN